MNFYIDFEATQYSERIISIGCIAENGARFETLVKPVKNEKVNAFITQLTGITNEMLEDAPTADEAFNAFYEFVKTNNDSSTPTYYCYGNCDTRFIKRTVAGMSDFQAIMFASSIQALLVDYSEGLVTLDKDALANAPAPIKQASSNNAFNEVYNKLIEEQGKLSSVKMAGRDFTQQDRVYLKQLRTEWANVKAADVSGDATAENYHAKLTHIRTGAVKYFSEPWVAAMFLNRCVLSGRSSKDPKSINATMKAMGVNPNNYGGYRCEFIHEINNVAV